MTIMRIQWSCEYIVCYYYSPVFCVFVVVVTSSICVFTPPFRLQQHQQPDFRFIFIVYRIITISEIRTWGEQREEESEREKERNEDIRKNEKEEEVEEEANFITSNTKYVKYILSKRKQMSIEHAERIFCWSNFFYINIFNYWNKTTKNIQKLKQKKIITHTHIVRRTQSSKQPSKQQKKIM